MNVTVKCKVRFAREPNSPEREAPPPEDRPVSRAARMLALAYSIERLVESGALKDYAEAARRLGVTRARMTQVVNLLNLPAPVQEALLTDEVAMSERQLRKLTSKPDWDARGL